MDQIGNTPIFPVASWTEAQAHATAGLDLVMELPSSQLIRVDKRLLKWMAPADSLVPADIVDPGSPWQLRTVLDKSMAALPAGWTATAGALSGGGGAGDLVLTAATGAVSDLTYALGVAGTNKRVTAVFRASFVPTGAAANWCGTSLGMTNKYIHYTGNINGYRKFTSSLVAYPSVITALAGKATHFEVALAPTAAQDSTIIQLPETNGALADNRCDGLGAWPANVTNEYFLFRSEMRGGGGTVGLATIQHCIIYTVPA
jgi:hypothetical protein